MKPCPFDLGRIQNMKPAIAVLSYSGLTTFLKEIKEHYQDKVNIIVVDAVLEEALEKALEIEKKGLASVFVSAGGNARLLSKELKSPFVEIRITGFDVLLALNKARQYSKRIALISYRHKIPYLDQVVDMLNIDLKQVTYGKLEEMDSILKNLESQGYRTVVGASLVTEKAQERGLNGVFIYSLDGVTRAMDAAANIALSKQAEWEKAERLRIIIDFAYDGIIATDKKGFITVFNPSAEKIIGLPRQRAINCNIDKVLDNSRMIKVMETGEPELNQIQSSGDIKILTNRIPIIVNGEVTGAVATFQNIDTIKKAEEKIRRKLHEKGFLAKTCLDDIIGDSRVMQDVKKEAELYAQSNSTVLILGESGTGKELFAQSIHNASARSKRPFIAINCAALPDSLLESELFGYEEGAFTGAKKGGKAGFFELAHGGTIFLDEIGGISPKLQSRLLRVIEEREVMRIGGDHIIPVDIRIIAATNKNLWQKVKDGKFRKDLYYRLNVLELALPPLRERKEDIPELIKKFLTAYRPSLKKKEIDMVAGRHQFLAYDWPGNVRELANVIERFAVLYNGEKESIPVLIEAFFNKQRLTKSSEQKEEIREIRKVLEEVNGNKTEAARRLGISRTTLWRKLKK
jgi:propionate catabolism operon transcriptional regulator